MGILWTANNRIILVDAVGQGGRLAKWTLQGRVGSGSQTLFRCNTPLHTRITANDDNPSPDFRVISWKALTLCQRSGVALGRR